MTAIAVRMGRAGWERWNGFTEEWDPMPFHIAMMSQRDLGRAYEGTKIVFKPLVGSTPEGETPA